MTLLSLQDHVFLLLLFIKVTFTHKYEWDRTDVECQTFFFHLERANLTNSCRKYYSFCFFTPYSCKHYLLYKWTELNWKYYLHFDIVQWIIQSRYLKNLASFTQADLWWKQHVYISQVARFSRSLPNERSSIVTTELLKVG